ncbi:hypothetical protein CSIM01_13691, partial [Colletotrichum simmondsii]
MVATGLEDQEQEREREKRGMGWEVPLMWRGEMGKGKGGGVMSKDGRRCCEEPEDSGRKRVGGSRRRGGQCASGRGTGMEVHCVNKTEGGTAEARKWRIGGLSNLVDNEEGGRRPVLLDFRLTTPTPDWLHLAMMEELAARLGAFWGPSPGVLDTEAAWWGTLDSGGSSPWPVRGNAPHLTFTPQTRAHLDLDSSPACTHLSHLQFTYVV